MGGPCCEQSDTTLPNLNNNEIADCAEVVLIISKGLKKMNERQDDAGVTLTCEGVSLQDREIGQINALLTDLGLSLTLIDDTNEEQGVVYDDIKHSPIVIYHNGGYAQASSDSLPQALKNASDNGQALFFLGDDLGYEAKKTSDEHNEENTFFNFYSITEYTHNCAHSEGFTFRVDTDASTHPVIVGEHGTVEQFEYYDDSDIISIPTSTPAKNIVLLMEGEGCVVDGVDGYADRESGTTPAVFATETNGAPPQRTLYLNANILTTENYCSVSNPQGLLKLNRLFENGIEWLLGNP